MKPYNYAKHHIEECRTDDPARKCARLFAEENMGSLLVKDEQGAEAGLLTDKVLFKAIAEGANLAEKKVSDLQIEPLIRVGKDAGIEEIREKFPQSPSGRLAMCDKDGKIVGILKKKNIQRFYALRMAREMTKK